MAQSSNQETRHDTPCDQSAEISQTAIILHLSRYCDSSWRSSHDKKFSGSLNTNLKKLTTEMSKKKSQRALHSKCSLFQIGETVHLFPALSLTSLTHRHKLGHHVNPHFNNTVAKQFDKPNPLHKYLSRTENLKTTTDIIHLLSTVIQAPMQKIHKAVGELLGNANMVEKSHNMSCWRKWHKAQPCSAKSQLQSSHLISSSLCVPLCAFWLLAKQFDTRGLYRPVFVLIP